MKPIGLDVHVRDSVFPPGATEGTIRYEKPGTKARYKVWLYLWLLSVPYSGHQTSNGLGASRYRRSR